MSSPAVDFLALLRTTLHRHNTRLPYWKESGREAIFLTFGLTISVYDKHLPLRSSCTDALSLVLSYCDRLDA
jgi:hypothetical protein